MPNTYYCQADLPLKLKWNQLRDCQPATVDNRLEFRELTGARATDVPTARLTGALSVYRSDDAGGSCVISMACLIGTNRPGSMVASLIRIPRTLGGKVCGVVPFSTIRIGTPDSTVAVADTIAAAESLVVSCVAREARPNRLEPLRGWTSDVLNDVSADRLVEDRRARKPVPTGVVLEVVRLG